MFTSVKKPTAPRLIPNIGVSYSRIFLAEPNKVPSPPKTMSKSICFKKSSVFNSVRRLFLISEPSSIKISEVYFASIGNSESGNDISPSF